MNLILQKLKREWKTFSLAVLTTVGGAWELASAWGADLPSLFGWVDEQYRSGVLFLVGLGFLFLRKYTPTTVTQVTEVKETPPDTTTTTTTVTEDK